MTGKLTQKARLLRTLRARGHRGVLVTEFLGPNVCDGGDPITRLATYVRDLRREGYAIRTDMTARADHRVARYVLERDIGQPVPASVEEARPSAALPTAGLGGPGRASCAPAPTLFDAALGAAAPTSALTADTA